MPAVAVLPFYRVGAAPLALEIMRIYNAGSSVYASVYSDAAGTTPMGNSDIVPIQANGYGLFPVVFVPVSGSYDIKYYSVEGVPRDTYEGIKPAVGTGGPGVESHTVLVDGADSTAGYLVDKLLDSPGLTWTFVDNAGYKQLQPLLQPAAILDGKVKTDAGDGVPGYLSAKIAAGRYINVDMVDHQIVLSFAGPDYVPASGGTYTGPVAVDGLLEALGGATLSTALVQGHLQAQGATTLNTLTAGNTIINGPFALTSVPGSGSWLAIDNAGNITRSDLTGVQPYRLWVSDADGKLTSYASLTYDGTNLAASKLITPNIALSDLLRAESSTGRVDLTPDMLSMIGIVGGVPDPSTYVELTYDGLKAQSPYNTWAVVVDRFGRNGQFPGRVQFSAELDGPGTQAYIVDDSKLLYDGSKLTVPRLKIDGLTAGALSVDANGNVVSDGAADKVAVDAGDTIPGFLSTKIVAGTGIRFTTTSDGVNGKVIHVSATAAGGGANGYRARELTFAQRESHPVTTPFNCMSLDIPAGTWDITAMGCYNCGVGSGSYAQLFAAISTVPDTLTDDAYQGFSSPCPYMAANPGFTQSVTLAPKRMTFAVDTTIYLVLQHWGAIASGGESWGHITARQVIA